MDKEMWCALTSCYKEQNLVIGSTMSWLGNKLGAEREISRVLPHCGYNSNGSDRKREWECGLKVQKRRGKFSRVGEQVPRHKWTEGISSVHCASVEGRSLICVLGWTRREELAPRSWAPGLRRQPCWLPRCDPVFSVHMLEFHLAPHIRV